MIFDTIFKNKQNNEPKFITGCDFNSALEHLLLEANQFIVLVSPYIKFNSRVLDILQRKRDANVTITIIHRENFNNSDITKFVYRRSNLHAKCYLTENGFLLGSMNLYEYSQINNDELGILIYKDDFPETYKKCYEEIRRLAKNYNFKNQFNKSFPEKNMKNNQNQSKLTTDLYIHNDKDFVVNTKYTYQQIKNILCITNNINGGINKINPQTIVLIWNTNSPYKNKQVGDTIYYIGHKTGPGKQELIYGNKALYDAYVTKNIKIHLFKDGIYCGEVYIESEPYYENNQLVFPLKYINSK